MSADVMLIRPDRASDMMLALRRKPMAEDPEERKPWEIMEYEDEFTLEPVKVALIRASGVLARDVEGYWGCCDLGELAEEIEEADKDANLVAIIVEMDSPGGTVNGTPEAAQRIARVDKPVMFWSEGEMCSAAYWLAASADHIAVTPSAITASIGCVLGFYDLSEMMGQMGVKVQVFRSGELKAAGYPGTALSEREAQHFQERVDSIGNDFAEWVTTYRDGISLDAFDGRSMTGKEALAAGVVDANYITRDEAVQAFLAMVR